MPTVVNSGNTPQVETSVNVQPQTSVVNNPTPKQRADLASRIHVNQIVDAEVPIVVFVGPPASGKSMILVRLAKYLFKELGYRIETDDTFLNDSQYVEDCEEFNYKLDTTIALDGTVKYLLINVYDPDGNLKAKLLEAPGEDFYDIDPTTAKENNKRLLPYLATIMASPNPKSYVVLLDLDSEVSFRRDEAHRDAYTKRFLKDFYPKINGAKDRIILLYNKIDLTKFGNINGCTNPKGARRDAELNYKSLFTSMKIQKLGGFMTFDNFEFLTFCTGLFSPSVDNFGNKIQTYNVADNVYPETLWHEITRKW